MKFILNVVRIYRKFIFFLFSSYGSLLNAFWNYSYFVRNQIKKKKNNPRWFTSNARNFWWTNKNWINCWFWRWMHLNMKLSFSALKWVLWCTVIVLVCVISVIIWRRKKRRQVNMLVFRFWECNMGDCFFIYFLSSSSSMSYLYTLLIWIYTKYTIMIFILVDVQLNEKKKTFTWNFDRKTIDNMEAHTRTSKRIRINHASNFYFIC